MSSSARSTGANICPWGFDELPQTSLCYRVMEPASWTTAQETCRGLYSDVLGVGTAFQESKYALTSLLCEAVDLSQSKLKIWSTARRCKWCFMKYSKCIFMFAWHNSTSRIPDKIDLKHALILCLVTTSPNVGPAYTIPDLIYYSSANDALTPGSAKQSVDTVLAVKLIMLLNSFVKMICLSFGQLALSIQNAGTISRNVSVFSSVKYNCFCIGFPAGYGYNKNI